MFINYFLLLKGNCDRKEEKKDKRICNKNNIDIIQ